MINKIRYMYLRDASKQPIGCVAIRLHRKKGYLEYQVSMVNPIDRTDQLTGKNLPFNRTMARHLAAGRMMEEGLVVSMNEDATMNEVSILVMADLANMYHPSHPGDIPARAIKAAKLWFTRQNNQEKK